MKRIGLRFAGLFLEEYASKDAKKPLATGPARR